jgi:hypothetical protein
MQAHVFIDNSNIFGGAQNALKTQEPTTPWPAIRIYYKNFFKLIEGSDTAVTKILAGSMPPGNDELWEHARNCGYNTDLLKRIEQDNGRLTEQGVDEILHLKIANVLLDYEPPQKLIVCTGDGQQSTCNTSFTEQIERAVRRKWNVDIWSWKDQLSNKLRRLYEKNNALVNINELDSYYYKITFIKNGTYHVGLNQFSIQGRVVSTL